MIHWNVAASRPRLGVLVALLLLIFPAAARAATTIDREFTYPAGRFTVRDRDGVTDVDVEGATREFVAGRPDLPWVSEAVEVPTGMRVVRIQIEEIATEPLAQAARIASSVRAVPGLGSIERTPPDAEHFTAGRLEPAEPVQLGYQGYQRGRNLAWIRVSPVRWEPGSGRLERVSRVRVRLVLEPGFGAPLLRERVVPEWEEGNFGVVAKPEARPATSAAAPPGFEVSQLPSVLGSPVAYVIVTNDSMAPEFQRLADWKTQTGVAAVVRTMAVIREEYPYGADDADRVRQFLRDAYTRWGTKWVLLGGDVDVVPTRYAHTIFYGGENIACDMYFSCLDGNWNADGDSIYGEGRVDSVDTGDQVDLLPDVWVGRAPCLTRDDAKLFVNKTLQYEKTPVGDYENTILYFAQVLFPEDWAPGQYVQTDGAAMAEETLPYVKSKPGIHYARLYQNYTYSGFEPGALPETRSAVLDSLDHGYNMSVHIGHGYRNVMSLGGGNNLVNTDALALSNGNRLTNLYSINCTSNAIDFPCIGEAFILAPAGGAVTNVGSTRLDFPSAGRAYQKEYFRLVFQDTVNAVGEAQARQKLPFVANAGSDNVHRWTQFTLLLLGDPELRIWTALPKTLTVTHPASIFVSDSTIAVNVKISGVPLAGARVVAYKAGDEYQVRWTDASGNATVPFRADSTGAITLTVVSTNCRPYQGTIGISNGAQPELADRPPVIDDDASGGTSGNADGKLDAGETVDLKIQVKNTGGATASSVVGTLTTTDPLATIAQSTVSYSSIAAGATTNVTAAYRVSVPATAPSEHEIRFNLRLQDGSGRSWNETIPITCMAPILIHYSQTVIDAGGNADGHPDPGETVQYLVKLRNLGSGSALSVTAKLRRHDGLSTITDSTSSWGTVLPGEEKQGDAMVFSPSSYNAVLELRISDSHGLVFTKNLDLIAPATPVDVSGTGSVSSIALSWTHGAEPDLRGYNVYRSGAALGPFSKLTAVPTERTSYYVDEGLTPLTRYYYRVSAVDSSGNESATSAVIQVSTNPPSHALFPFPLGGQSKSSVAVDHVYPGHPLTIVTGADILYAWNSDGTSPVDADGSTATSGDFSRVGTNFVAPPSIADLTGDGPKEIVASSWDSLRTYAFDRNGNVLPGWPVTTTDPVWSAAAIGDLNNDGSKEIVFGSNGMNIYAFRANGTEFRDGDNNPATNGVFKHADTPYNFGTPALADLVGDGKLEVIYGSSNGWIYAIRPDGTPAPGWNVFHGSPGAHIYGSVAVGHLDGPSDTQYDIVVPIQKDDGTDSVFVFKGNGQIRAGWPVAVRISGGDIPPSPALADMNNDGFLDVVCAGTDGVLHVFDRNGVPLPPVDGVRFSQPLFPPATQSSPVIADINGDGFNDVVIGDEQGNLNAVSGLGTMLPGFPIQLGAEVKSTPALCDCDGDGMTEIIVSGWDQKLYQWDYDYPFSPNGPPPWPMFHHDAARTGRAESLVWTAVGDTLPHQTVLGLEFAAPSPNPAVHVTRISWAIPDAQAGEPLDIAIYDLLGRRVRVIEHGPARAGRFAENWDLSDQSGARVESGVFFVRYALGRESHSHKLAVVR